MNDDDSESLPVVDFTDTATASAETTSTGSSGTVNERKDDDAGMLKVEHLEVSTIITLS